MTRERLTLKNKKSGKQISSVHHLEISIGVATQQAREKGCGGGVVSLITYPTGETKREIEEKSRNYEAVLVEARGGGGVKVAERSRVRSALESDELIVQLAEKFRLHIDKKYSSTRQPHALSVEQFVRWVNAERQQTGSGVFQIMKRLAPDLLDVDRGDRWWADQITKRRKTQS